LRRPALAQFYDCGSVPLLEQIEKGAIKSRKWSGIQRNLQVTRKFRFATLPAQWWVLMKLLCTKRKSDGYQNPVTSGKLGKI